jgi:aquaporin NIP
MPKYFSEFIGTFALVFCGTGAIVINEVSGGTVGHLGIAITFGLIVAAMIYAVGEVSGAHFNPAVTLSFSLAGLFPRSEVIPYLTAQLLGAVVASGVLRLLFPEAVTLGETEPAGSVMQTFVLELILTFFLMFVILQVSTGSKEMGTMAGLAIGMVVLLEAAFAGPITGASMNPARSFGPALLTLKFENLWVYFLAPTMGAFLSVGAWWIIRRGK